MRFSEQRASMGGSGKTEAGLAAQDAQHPAQKLFVTPRREVDTLCRLALLRYLEVCGADLAEAARVQLARVVDMSPGGDEHLPQLPMHVSESSPLPLRGGGDAPLASALQRARDARSSESSAQEETCEDVWARLKNALDNIKIVDPACGEAHMLIGVLDLLDGLLQLAESKLGMDRTRQARRLSIVRTNLFGVEAQRGTLSRAQKRLMTAVGGPYSSTAPALSPNLIRADSLVEREEFHWSVRFDQVMQAGGFHMVLGNPPYVRHEYIADPLNRQPAEKYKEEAFTAAQARLEVYLDSLPAGETPIVLSRRSDLSLLFTVFGLTLLRPGGVLGFVLPSAVLSARYGEPLWHFLSSADLDSQLVENHSRRTFVDAGVNTVLLLAGRLAQVVATAEQREVGARCGPLNSPSSVPGHPPTGHVGSGINQLQRRIEEHCTSLGSIGRLRYPIKTGLNCFFYPNAETRARFRVEPEFLIPVVKSPRDVRTLILPCEDLPSVLFHCPRSPAQLRQVGAAGALSYIAWGAEQTRRSGNGSARTLAPWPSVPSLRGRDLWYAVPLPNAADVLCPRFLHRRFFFALPAGGILEDQTFYGLELASGMQQQLVGALLNSTLAYFMMETHGRTGLGDGVRQFALNDMAGLPVPDINRADYSLVPELTHLFGRLASRPILPIEEEVRQADRIELDSLVCAAIGLSETDGADARGYVTALVNQRLDRAKRR